MGYTNTVDNMQRRYPLLAVSPVHAPFSSWTVSPKIIFLQAAISILFRDALFEAYG